MPWDSTTQIMTCPLNIDDIVGAAGYSHGDLGTIITNGPSINKWAKYKPVVLATWGHMNQLDMQLADRSQWNWKSNSDWWKGTTHKCGFDFSVFVGSGDPDSQTQNTFLYKLQRGLLPWNYVRPTGGSSAPFRMDDFIQYFGGAICPIGDLASTNITFQPSGDNFVAQLSFDSPTLDSRNLTLADIEVPVSGVFTPLSQFYLGVFMRKGNNGVWNLVTSPNPMGGNNSTLIDITVSNRDAYIGEWNVAPFLSSAAIQLTDQAQANTVFCSMNGMQPFAITLVKGTTTIIATGIFNSTNTSISFIIEAVNNDRAKQVTNLQANIYRVASGGDPSQGTLIASSSPAISAAIGANTTQQIHSGTIAVSNIDKTNYDYWIIASFTENYDTSAMPVEDDDPLLA